MTQSFAILRMRNLQRYRHVVITVAGQKLSLFFRLALLPSAKPPMTSSETAILITSAVNLSHHGSTDEATRENQTQRRATAGASESQNARYRSPGVHLRDLVCRAVLSVAILTWW